MNILNIIEGIKDFCITISRKLSKIYLNISEETTDFNPVDTKFIEGNGVTYGLGYQDKGDGTSKVQLIVSSLYQLNVTSTDQSSKSVVYNTGKSIPNTLKDQLSLSLVEDSVGVDRVGITFPEEGINEKKEKYIKNFLFNTYKVEHSVDTSSVEYLGRTKLPKNINNDSSANTGNIYSDPQTVTLANGDVIVIAKNLKDKTLVFWYLEYKNGKFEALVGENGVTERELLKLSNTGNQFILNGNKILYSQIKTEIIGNQEVEIKEFFAFDITEAAENLENGERIGEYLLCNKDGQINGEPFFSSEHEISFLQYVERGESDTVAFLEKDKSSNKQRLHLLDISNGKDSTIYEFKDHIDQLYVKGNDQGGFTVTAIIGENIVTFYSARECSTNCVKPKKLYYNEYKK